MKIGVVNAGSSSLKFKLFQGKDILAKVIVENIAKADSRLTLKYGDKEISALANIENHYQALLKIIESLSDYNVLKSLDELDAVGHRVVHGGEEFCEAVLIDDAVIQKIKLLKSLDPLHNEANLEGITVIKNIAPLLKQIAVFDTAFHSSLPKEAYLYALEAKYYNKHKIRRYGFHGSSHSYLSRACATELKKDVKELNIVTLHLGNGSSACAIRGGISVDTTMGFTPLEGIVMGTRCGDIDAGIIFYMQRELGLSIDEVDDILNKKSGLLGLAGSNDFRDITSREDEDAKLVVQILSRSIKKYIGAYMAILGRVDAIVFSGGIGENSSILRESVLVDIGFGIVLDSKANIENKNIISTSDSKITVMVLKTDEEAEIAQECIKLLCV